MLHLRWCSSALVRRGRLVRTSFSGATLAAPIVYAFRSWTTLFDFRPVMIVDVPRDPIGSREQRGIDLMDVAFVTLARE